MRDLTPLAQKHMLARMPKMNYPALKRRIHSAGISLAKVCRHAGVAQTTLVRWQSGATEPRPDTWARIKRSADALIREHAGDATPT